MERNEDLKSLVEAFKGYRDLLSPIQQGLADFLETYDSVRGDIEKLNSAFDGTAQESLKSISATLAAQAEKSTDLSSRIDQFIRTTNRFGSQMNEICTLFEKAEQKVSAINALESKVSEQIQRLDAVIEEKKINYNLKDLQRSLEGYDGNVRKVSDFINKDVAAVLSDNAKKIEEIRSGEETLLRELLAERDTLASLLESGRQNGELLRRIVDKGDVDEAYIFEILDRWAAARKVKMKR